MTEKIKLMKPLFLEGTFNHRGVKRRAVFEKEIANGTDTFQIWRDPDGPGEEYELYVELNGYLVPLGVTEESLESRCGLWAAIKELYGDFESRDNFFSNLQNGENYATLFNAAVEAEKRAIARFGSDQAIQADFIARYIAGCVELYKKAKETAGEIAPDYVGALAMGELDQCQALKAAFQKNEQHRAVEQAKQEELENRKFCDEQNAAALRKVENAKKILRNGGWLENYKVIFYRTPYDEREYSVVNYLLRQYQIPVPLRTQGWIIRKLKGIAVSDGRCTNVLYQKSKKGKCSDAVFDYINELIGAVLDESSKT